MAGVDIEIDPTKLRELADGLADMNDKAIAAAGELRRIADAFDLVSDRVRRMGAVGTVGLASLEAEECQCPNCTARRKSEAEAKRFGLN